MTHSTVDRSHDEDSTNPGSPSSDGPGEHSQSQTAFPEEPENTSVGPVNNSGRHDGAPQQPEDSRSHEHFEPTGPGVHREPESNEDTSPQDQDPFDAYLDKHLGQHQQDPPPSLGDLLREESRVPGTTDFPQRDELAASQESRDVDGEGARHAAALQKDEPVYKTLDSLHKYFETQELYRKDVSEKFKLKQKRSRKKKESGITSEEINQPKESGESSKDPKHPEDVYARWVLKPSEWKPEKHGTVFQYNQEGQIIHPGEEPYSFSSEDIKFYLDTFVSLNDPSSKSSPLEEERSFTAWVQKPPFGLTDRQRGGEGERDHNYFDCCWEGCPSYGSIAQGFIQVAFDEFANFTNGKAKDPFMVAMHMHLYCLEKVYDIGKLHKAKLLKVDDRHLQREEINRFSLVSWAGRHVITDVFEPFFENQQINQGSLSGEFQPLSHVQSLCFKLTEYKKNKEPQIRQKTREARREKAKREDRKYLTIDEHVGNLSEFAKTQGLHRKDDDGEEGPTVGARKRTDKGKRIQAEKRKRDEALKDEEETVGQGKRTKTTAKPRNKSTAAKKTRKKSTAGANVNAVEEAQQPMEGHNQAVHGDEAASEHDQLERELTGFYQSPPADKDPPAPLFSDFSGPLSEKSSHSPGRHFDYDEFLNYDESHDNDVSNGIYTAESLMNDLDTQNRIEH